MPYTMSCSSNSSGGRARSWYRNGDIILRTRYVSLTQCVIDVANDNVYRTLSGRLNASCSTNLYSLTLLVSASDNGSVWWCLDDVTDRTSNTLTISVVTETSVISPPPTTTKPPTPAQSNPGGGVYIGAGVAGGVVVVIVVGVSVLCMRRKRDQALGSRGDDNTHRMETGTSSYPNLCKNDGEETSKIILVENDIYESSNDVT